MDEVVVLPLLVVDLTSWSRRAFLAGERLVLSEDEDGRFRGGVRVARLGVAVLMSVGFAWCLLIVVT